MLKKLYMMMIVLLLTVSSCFALTLGEAKQHLEQTINALEETLNDNDALIEENTMLKEELKNSADAIKDLQSLLDERQKEINSLRENIEELSTQVDEDKNMILGIDIGYPLKAEVMFGARPNDFPLGGFVTGSLSGNFTPQVSLGVFYNF